MEVSIETSMDQNIHKTKQHKLARNNPRDKLSLEPQINNNKKTLAKPTMFAGYNNNQKIPDPVIPWMLENSKFNTKLDTSMKFASTTSNEQKIYATSEKIITYVNGLHEHLTKIIHPILSNLISLQLSHSQ